MEMLPTQVTSPRYWIGSPRALVMLFEKLVTVNLTPTSRLGRVLALMHQTYHLSPKTAGQRVLMIGIVAYLHGVMMIAIVLLTVELALLMKRGRTLACTSYRHAMICLTARTTETNAKTTQAVIAMIGLQQELQDYPLRTSPWIAHDQATGSLMRQTLVASIPVTGTSRLLETTALAVFHEGVITLIMIL